MLAVREDNFHREERKNMIFESHAHYDDQAFDADREALLSSFIANGIEYVVNVGAGIQSVKDTMELMEKYHFMYGALGIHPSETAEMNEKNYRWLKEQCLQKHHRDNGGKVVAVGEIGLDYYWDVPDRDIQKNWFVRQLEMAGEVRLPVIIHSREAAKDTLDILKEHQNLGLSGVMHCYSYSKETAREFLELDFYIGIGGVVTFGNAKKLKEAVEYIPLDRILLETDSPYLAPVPYRGKRNSSLNLPLIAEEVARLKGVGFQEVIDSTTRNAGELFGL